MSVCVYRVGVSDFTALRKKLSFSLLVMVLMFLYLFHERRGTNRPWPRWVGSVAMSLALFVLIIHTSF